MSEKPQDESESVEARSERDVATLLYRNGGGGMLVSIVFSAVVVFAFSGSTPDWQVWLWWLTIFGIFILRVVDMAYWRLKVKNTRYCGKTYKKRYTIGLLAVIAVWSLYPFMVIKHIAFVDLACTMVVLTAMAGGSASVLSAYRLLAGIFTTGMLLPMSLLCLFSDQQAFTYMGGLGLVFWAITLVLSRKSAEFTRTAVFVHNQNMDLLKDMAEEKQAVSDANRNLEAAYRHINDVNGMLEQKVQKRTEALENLATRDPLTGLLNRKAFQSALQAKIANAGRTGEQFALFFLDLDGFKEINDLKGHVSGDRVLSDIASRLTGLVGFDQSRCRWGGDEFIITSSVSSQEEAIFKSKGICALISRPVADGYDTLHVGVTVGIALYPDHGRKEHELIQAADLAMYSKKHAEKGGSVLFSAKLQAQVHHEQLLSQDLHSAINNEEFSILYQPIVSADGLATPICFEALLRWNKPDAGYTPETFIPIAESSGSIVEIGEWVLLKACTDAASGAFPKDAKVSINVSIRQMMDVGFLDSVKFALMSSRLSPSRLHIEVTESLFAQDRDTVSKKLSRLRDMGVKVSIDDFGTGFSSLSYLQTLPVDQIKIDRSFIQKGEASMAIISATISIARALGCTVVAEGIESKADQQRLKALGVDYLQGFLFSEPLDKVCLAHWYEQTFTDCQVC